MKYSKNTSDINKSGLVSSGQAGVHPQLEKYVRRHLVSVWPQPLHPPTVEVYQRVVKTGVFASARPIILDSGCGTGKSTRWLAELNPGHLVIGVDQSLARLGKSGVGNGLLQRNNCLIARAELATFWRLLHAAEIKLDKHLLLYPNPWPKPGHLQRRWHAHPVFPWILALGGEIELRCNWEIYALEFAVAVQIATGRKVEVKQYRPGQGISPFEAKYLERGHLLYSVKVPKTDTATFSLAWKGAE